MEAIGSGMSKISSGTPVIEIRCSSCEQLQKRTTTKLAPFNEQPESGIPIKLIPDTVEELICSCSNS